MFINITSLFCLKESHHVQQLLSEHLDKFNLFAGEFDFNLKNGNYHNLFVIVTDRLN